MTMTYLVTLMDEDTDEYIDILAYGERDIELILSRKPKHHQFISATPIGATIDTSNYLMDLTDGNNLNFGGENVN